MSRATSLSNSGQVCLQFMNKLHQLHESRLLCDLLLELRNEKFHAHKVVLAAWSPAVCSLLSDTPAATDITIRIHYDNAQVFSSFLAFLYSGQMDEVAQENLIQILHLATSLQVNDLRQMCEEALKRQVHIANIISTYHVARKFRLPNLEEFALNYMQMNLPEAVKQADFLSLSPPRFNSFLSSGWVCIMKPEVKLFLIISWLGYDVKERQQYLVLLLRYIDWSSVANDFLNEISQTENFFTTNESSLYLLLQTLFSSSIPLGPYQDSFAGLRDKYAYLLDHIVQNSYVLPVESDEYFPVMFHLVFSEARDDQDGPHASSEFGGRLSTAGEGSDGLSCQLQQAQAIIPGSNVVDRDRQALENNTDFDPSFSHDLSNDSVTAGIGLGLKKVTIAETHSVFGSGNKPAVSDTVETTSKTRKKQSSAGSSQISSQAETSMPASLAESHALSLSKSVSPAKAQKGSKKKGKSPIKATQRNIDHPKEVDSKPISTRSRKRGMEKSGDEPSPTKQPSLAQKTTSVKTKAVKNGGMEKSSPVKQEPGDTNSNRMNGRPKRLAAAKFNVLEKLMPRKTKASLKQAFVPPPQPSNHRRADATHNKDQDNVTNRTSDDDDEDDMDEIDDADEDSGTDPDYSLPQKETRSTRLSQKNANTSKVSSSKTSSKATKVRGKSLKVVNAGRQSVEANKKFTSVKLKKKAVQSQSMLRNILTDSTVPVEKAPKEEPKAEENSDAAEEEECEEEQQEEEEEMEMDDMKTEKDAPPVKRKCAECEYTAPTQRRLANHVERVHGNRATLFVCGICQFECKWNKKFYEHMKLHFSGPPYVCDHDGCGWEADRIQVLLIHRRRHTDERPHKCPHCAARFKTRNNLIAHLKCHSENRDHECPVCHRRFRMKNTMEQHMVTHSDNRPYLCDTCGFSTKFQSHLISHKRIHTGEVFKCGFPMCDYSSPKKSQLKAHMRSHLNIRHHSCHICNKSFVEKSHLVRHLKIHQDVRPHKCDQCAYSSTRIDKVNEHRRKYHSEEAASKKRQYRYWSRSKKGVGDRSKKGEEGCSRQNEVDLNKNDEDDPNKKAECDQTHNSIQPAKKPIPPITAAAVGQSVCSKRGKNTLPASLVTLASAAEVMDLRNPFPVAVSYRRVNRPKKQDPKKSVTKKTAPMNPTMTEGNVSSFETEGSKGMIQIDVNYGLGGSTLKNESHPSIEVVPSVVDSGRPDTIIIPGENMDMVERTSRDLIQSDNKTEDQMATEQGKNGILSLVSRGIVSDSGVGASCIVKSTKTSHLSGTSVLRDQSSSQPNHSPFSQQLQQQQLPQMFITANSSSHTSAALLQQLAMSASSMGTGQHQSSQNPVEFNSGPTLLPQTATPDVEAASHILIAAMQHHTQQLQQQHNGQQQHQHHSQLLHSQQQQQQHSQQHFSQQQHHQQHLSQQQQQHHNQQEHHNQQHHPNQQQLYSQQHSAAAVSAADSLASLSYGVGQQPLSGQPEPGSRSHHASQNPEATPVHHRRHVLLHQQHHSLPKHQHFREHYLQQPQHQQHQQQSQQQHQQLQQQQQQQQSEEYNGLNVFMPLL